MSELTHHTYFTPAYDHRGDGQHPMHIAFVVKGKAGALVFDINTGWYIDRSPSNSPAHVRVWGLSRHRYLDADPLSDDFHDNCGWLDGEPCVNDNPWGYIDQRLTALLDLFLREGPEPLFKQLDTIYKELMNA